MNDKWVKDIRQMHQKYGVQEAVDKLPKKKLEEFLRFRAECVNEEVEELLQAAYAPDPEETVDALIDICVFAIGTLDLFGVDATKAWDEVLKANLNKEVGVKEGRPNPYGLPDLIKPEGWKAPDHTGNHGKISEL